MKLSKLILNVGVTGFSMWVISGLWHNLILANFYAKAKGASHEGIGILLISYFILAGFMVFLYTRYYQGGKPVLEGLKFGAIIGILWVFPHDLAMAGAHGEPMAYVFKNGIWHAVEQGLGGIVMGLIYSRFQNSQ